MSPVKVFCQNPDCDASYSVVGDLIGRNVRCKKCGTSFIASETAPPTRNRTAVPIPEPLDIPKQFGKYRVLTGDEIESPAINLL